MKSSASLDQHTTYSPTDDGQLPTKPFKHKLLFLQLRNLKAFSVAMAA
jgi:hypothetical protein